ncbi:ribosomal protein S18-alanine N-acetyltransferase [Lactobacillus panisapium]|uniref:Ribosomal protein S18-alanine N-acetyltransferase n=2 Tax=Lactobacillus panisapium TaxID=2012495 RepID=A0ABX8WA76_9LACO|nr:MULTISPECIES: ribosomal protein S18-alanine N-acetyltransferase [Lactobacillus]MCX8723210.1 ribosomal protein S18-alanine N-acetyltransferase [Lactobacillus sp. B4005]MCX8737382.1 ribosomal protein S18-alanine N-acetyltransferase [Lactobacillus sp. B4026]QYN53225.1 ribosomal protein S18-alanine N-acetyltransferase [Lactobacillus panisapium]QYN55024.1 ribosomal protein S18-alanine N-acetyltransferase [Lactobacillus panisapium]QYN58976.1 ribosomal protein S18-alanine N-acetyltransferase [Lact
MWKRFKQFCHFSRVGNKLVQPTFRPFMFTLDKHVLQVMRAKESDIANLLFLETKTYEGRTPWAAEIFQLELQKKDSLYLVVYHKTALIAVIGMRLNLVEAHITNLAVDPAWQKKGLGTYLMQLMIDYARKLGCHSISLEVRIDNEVAKKLYQGLGFTVNFVRPNYYQDLHKDGLNMVLTLAPDDKESD